MLIDKKISLGHGNQKKKYEKKVLIFKIPAFSKAVSMKSRFVDFCIKKVAY